MDHIDECEANATLGLDILGKVKVVVLPSELFIYYFQHVGLRKLNRNVSDHERGLVLHFLVAHVVGVEYSLKLNLVVLGSD